MNNYVTMVTLYYYRSLKYVDLRLCYSNNITRTVMEADMSYFNGYQVGVSLLVVIATL